jgi:hypothetical protein
VLAGGMQNNINNSNNDNKNIVFKQETKSNGASL